jgi:hypothetical protein
MARQNKKTRIKGLPPKLLLQTIDNHTGSYPSKSKTTSFGLSGNGKSFYDDTVSINFITSSNFNFGANVSDELLNNKSYNILGQDISSSIEGTGVLRCGKSDAFILISHEDVSSAFVPFKEHLHSEINSLSDTFFATGSNPEIFGEGLDQPLHSKTKIIIDLTPREQHSFYMQNYLSSSGNRPMAYWNKDLKIWQGIGTGNEFASYDLSSTRSVDNSTLTTKHQNYFNEQCIGFSNGFLGFFNVNVAFNDYSKYFSFGQPTTTFGFPLHPKFHASASNAISMTEYINEPFLLEKVVVEVSCTFLQNNLGVTSSNDQYSQSYYSSIVNFFILNQRVEKLNESQDINIFVTSGSTTNTLRPTNLTSPVTYNNNFINETRDLVGWGQILSFAHDLEYVTSSLTAAERGAYDQLRFNKEVYIDNDNLGKITSGSRTVTDWTNNLQLKFVCKSPLKTENTLESVLTLINGDDPLSYQGSNGKSVYIDGYCVPGRKGMVVANPRDYLNAIGETFKDNISNTTPVDGSTVTLNSYQKLYKENPYLLMPSDKLILGWQLPVPKYLNKEPSYYTLGATEHAVSMQGKGPELIFPIHPAKITLYGSYLKEGKEYHDTLNQNLTSNTIYEIIG